MFLEIFIIMFFTIFFSLVIGFFLFGRYILGLLGVGLFFLALFITKLMQKRISPFLIINKREKKKKIEQSISLKMFILLSLKNNFKDEDVTSNVCRELSKSKSDIVKYFRHSKYKEFETTTNKIMYKHLNKISKDAGIQITKYEGTVKKKPQIMPKLILMGIKTNLLNVLNKKYWSYIFQPEEVAKYEITVK